MPYAEPFVQLTMNGVFGAAATTPAEIWSAGLKFRNPGSAPSPANLTSFIESVAVHASTFHAAGTALVGSNCWLTHLTAAFIGTDGKYVGGDTQATTRHTYGTPVAGNGTATAPWTQAIVTSLRTLVLRGPGSNGRMYYPATTAQPQATTGVLAPSLQASYATVVATFLNAVNNSADAHLPGTGGLSVMSKVGSGVAASVTALRVGARLDRQERRENKLSEAYITRSVTPLAAFALDRSHDPIGGRL